MCGSYLITDFAFLWRVGDAGREEQRYGILDYGFGRNIRNSNSIGGSIFFGADGARVQSGLKLHARHWVNPELSFGLAPGIILFANEEESSWFRGPGFLGQASMDLGGRFGITAQVFRIRRTTWPSDAVEGRETAWHLGIKLGAEPGIAAAPVFLIATLVSEMNDGGAVPNP